MSTHPPHAAHIWVEGGSIWLNLPSPLGAREHSLSFPNSESGLAVLLDVLRERERQPLGNTLGSAGAPCKRDVEEALKNSKRYTEILGAMSADKAEAEAFLKELGL